MQGGRTGIWDGSERKGWEVKGDGRVAIKVGEEGEVQRKGRELRLQIRKKMGNH